MNAFGRFLRDLFILYPDIDEPKTVVQPAKAPVAIVFPPTQIIHHDPAHQFIFEQAALVSHQTSFLQFTEVKDLISRTPRHDYGMCPCGPCSKIRMLSARMVLTLLEIAEGAHTLVVGKRENEIRLQDALARIRQY